MSVQTKSKPGAESIMLPAFQRDAQVVTESVKADARTFDIVWTAGAEVPRYNWLTGERYVEVLEVDAKSIRLDRLQSGRAPVLDSHSRYSLDNVMGVVVKGSVRVDKGEGRATVRLSAREDLAGVVSDVRDGIIANVSCGYVIHAFREEKRGDKLYRVATDWEPMEVSFVPIGADPDAGRRSAGDKAPEGPQYPCVVTRALPEVPAGLSAAEAARRRLQLV